MSLAVLLLLSFISAPQNIRYVASGMVSVGGFLYPFVWLFAGIYGPEIGRNVAKEKFAVLGYMGGVFIIGLIMVSILLVKFPLKISEEK